LTKCQTWSCWSA